MAPAQGARAADRHRGAADRDLRQGQRARHRRAGAGRAGHRARRQDPRLAVPRRGQAGGDDPQLRRHPPRAFHARRLGAELPRDAQARRVAQGRLDSPTAAAKRVDLDTLTPEEVQSWKARRPAAAQRHDAHRARRRAQAHPGHAGQGRGAAGRFQGPRDLLRRPGRSGDGRGRRPGRPDHRDADGQVHRHDARARPAGDDRQGRARAGRDAGDRQAQGRLPDGGRRRGLSRRAGDQGGQGGRLRGPRDGGDLRVHRRGHAGDRRGRCEGNNVHQLAPLVWQEKIARERLLAD